MELLRKGKERGAIFSVLEGYILLSVQELNRTIQPYMTTISNALLGSVTSIAETVAAEESAEPQLRPGIS
jgi:hypothetical protein